MPKTTPSKKQAPRPFTKANKLQTRASNADLQILLTKAHAYYGGNMAELLLRAALAYRPVRKGEGRKV